MLEVNQLFKRYGAFVAVKDVSFTVQPGEVYGLLGPNGAGKSTTIKVLSCLARPDGGNVTVDGHSVLSDSGRVKRLIGIVPQDLALYDDFSARENLLFFGRLYGLSGRELRDRANELLDEVGLLNRANARVGTFSGGMKRRINIAAGLMHRPKLLYLDEPTVGIDPQSRRRILDLVKGQNQAGLSVLYTTHYMEEAEELCHRIGIIDHGEIRAEGTLAELRRIAGELTPICITLRGTPTPEQLQAIEATAAAVSFEGQDLTVLSREPKTDLPRVLMQLAGYDLPVHHVEIREPDLEAVFLKLTGRRLRD
ncbi:MAG TPA: ABC transporter ATP-binding protein [Deinococcales bacterium]|nr:ABC transporter ATP-binding protein [Deinococcales bacterium]